MFEQLLLSRQYNLLPVSNLLASLVLGEDDQEWLNRRYKQMTDILKDAPAYRWMTEDAREEGREEERRVLAEERRVLLEQRQTLLEQLRGTVLEVVAGRFPKFVRLAKKQVRDAKSVESLQHLLVKISLAHEDDDIEQYLWDLDDESEGEK